VGLGDYPGAPTAPGDPIHLLARVHCENPFSALDKPEMIVLQEIGRQASK
jgi:hypothetical protein